MPSVSVIMPLYNSAQFMRDSIDSVLSQTFSDWELLLVDDGSVDESRSVAEAYARDDTRVRLMLHEENKGAAAARNTALGLSRGRYVAYLDSDDFWHPKKLERQLIFARENHFPVTITSYATVEENGDHRNGVIVPAVTNRHQFLVRPPTCTHTILIDTATVSRDLLIMPDLARRQDAATWLQLLKAGFNIHGTPEILAFNRKRPGSLSASRVGAVRGTWHLYSRVERLPAPYAIYCLSLQLLNAVKKRIRTKPRGELGADLY